MYSLKILFINILSMSTIASIVFLFISIARKIIKNKVDFEKCSLLWIIFIFVLIIPLNFESKLSIKNYIQIDKKFTLNPTEIFYDEVYESENIFLENNENINLTYKEIFSIIWIIVSITLIIKDTYIYNTCIDKKKTSKLENNILELLATCKKELHIKKDIKLVVQDKIRTPMLYGIFNTKILITNEILNFSTEELKCIFVHELNHYKNNHHLLYLIFEMIEKIHWFNPFINIAFKIIKEDLEIITDNNALKSNITKKEYCKTILKVASMCCSMKEYKMPTICGNKKTLERRIKQMKSKNNYTKISLVLLGMVILMISVITVSLASDKVNYAKENEIANLNNIFEKVEKEDMQNEEKVEYILPIENVVVTAKFGTRIHPITREEKFHSGIDLKAEEGTNIKAAADGIVEVATYDKEKGNYVEIKHKDGSISGYHHGAKILISVGDTVKAGEEIMTVGKTGMATGPHLHFEIRSKDGEYLDINQMIYN